MYFHRIVVAAALCVVFVGVAMSQVTSTRTTSYDWQCQDSAGAKISDHQREGTAIIACVNAPNGAYVQGGRYRITRATAPEPVRSASLSWTAPTQNDDGTALTDLAGYRIVYGNSPTALTQTVQVAPAVIKYELKDLTPGAWYFGVKAFNTSGKESPVSNVGSKVIL